LNKSSLLTTFSSDYEKYYKVSLFERLGFKRQGCSVCGRFYWSIVEKNICPDHQNYDFIGNPPTSNRYSYAETWNKIKTYFEKNGHSIVNRYPVVCRWREDLYYTIASIVDFQRIAENKVIFELPKNPLVVPQMCLRFNDIENVGSTGRHYTSFCMIGQTCDADSAGGYWKDRCIDLDFGMLVDVLGIPPSEITFVEDVWIGAGAFGCSLEYFVRGLELGNAVFTEFEGNEKNHRIMKNRIIDMGAGLERLCWITNGTPTSYDCTFESVLKNIEKETGFGFDSPNLLYRENPTVLSSYFKRVSSKLESNNDIHLVKNDIAKEIGIEVGTLNTIVTPFESLYTIVDHARTLVFAISDGSLPSNVGGGYNLRVILRRTLSLLKQLNLNIKLTDIVDFHIEQLSPMYKDLAEYRDDIHTILKIETDRHLDTQSRIATISSKIQKQKTRLSLDDLIRLYESDGVTPDYLVEYGLIDSIPSNFYTRLSEIHSSGRSKKLDKNDLKVDLNLDLDSITNTELLYYVHPEQSVFDAKVLDVIDNNLVVLDKTCFYPRGGGQEPDHGYIGPHEVDNVVKIKDVVLHHIKDSFPAKRGDKVTCIVQKERRAAITRNHTSTHIINQASRGTLGSWVWQNSAFKEEEYARLDITHHSALTRGQVEEIEKKANDIVRQNLPVSIDFYERGVAEQNFGFRIYQGGVVPSNKVRIVKVGDLDIEACGGTHVLNTGDIGLIKILKTERIQDGVVRIEFVAGSNALKNVQAQENQLQKVVSSLGTSRDKVLETLAKNLDELDRSKKRIKNMLKNTSELYIEKIIAESKSLSLKDPYPNDFRYYVLENNSFDEEFHLSVGKQASEYNKNLIYVGAVVGESGSLRIIVFAGHIIAETISAKTLASQISRKFGGSGGGNKYFGQGGGKFTETNQSFEKIVIESIESISKDKS
jgi:alanyl-tRNA synthetase